MVFMHMVKKIQVKYILAFLFIFLFLLLIGSGNVISPFYGDINLIDEGQFLAWINHMRSGDFLYKNTYAAYGPLLIYPFYLLSKIFEPSFFLYRMTFGVFGMLISLGIVILIFNKLKISFLFQLFAISLLIFIPGFGLRQAGGLLAIFMVYVAYTSSRYIWSFMTGLSIGASFLISSDMGIFSFFVIFVLMAIFFINAKNFSIYFKKLAYIIIGLIALFLPFTLITGSEGWLFSYISSIADDLVSYSGIGIPIGRKFPNIFELFPTSISILSLIKFTFSKEILNYWLIFFYIISFIYFFIKFMIKKVDDKDLLAFSITLFGFLLSTILIGRIGHFVFVVQIVFILFAYYLNLLFEYYKKTKLNSDKIFIAFAVLVICAFSLREVSIYRPHFNKIPDAIAAARIHDSNPPGVGNILISKEQEKNIKIIQNFIRENTSTQEKIYFLSNNPGLYFLVNRVSPSRFDLPGTANTRDRRVELVKDLENDKTKYIIEDTNAYLVDGISNRTRLPEVMDYIRLNYDVSRLGPYIIYTRKYSNISLILNY